MEIMVHKVCRSYSEQDSRLEHDTDTDTCTHGECNVHSCQWDRVTVSLYKQLETNHPHNVNGRIIFTPNL
jgi:hypothetical protein